MNFTMGGASAARGQAPTFNPSRVVDWNTAVQGESGAAAPALAPSAAEASREKKEVISWSIARPLPALSLTSRRKIINISF